MLICLIYLDTRRNKSHLPLGLAYVASHIVAAGHEVEVIPCETMHFDPGHIFSRLYRTKADVFGITAMYPEIDLAADMVRVIRGVRKKSTIILGGILPTTLPEFSLRKTGADIAVKGEAELTIVNLLDRLQDGTTALDEVKGLAWIDHVGQFHETGEPEIIEDLAKIRLPLRGAFPTDRIAGQYFYPQDNGCVVAEVITSRGCPFHCNFCYSVSRPRYRNVDDVFGEIEGLVRYYGVNSLNFLDENFVLNRKRMELLCEGIKRRNLQLMFSTTARASTVNEDIVGVLYDAGCRCVNIGLESGNQRMLDTMNKGVTTEQNMKAVEIARRAGMFVEYPCMVGNIGETEESMRSTFAMLKDLAWGDFQWRFPFFCTPYPGTEIYRYAVEKGLIVSDEDFYQKHKGFQQLSINLTEMPTNDFLRLYDELYSELKSHYFNALPRWKPIPHPLAFEPPSLLHRY